MLQVSGWRSSAVSGALVFSPASLPFLRALSNLCGWQRGAPWRATLGTWRGYSRRRPVILLNSIGDQSKRNVDRSPSWCRGNSCGAGVAGKPDDGISRSRFVRPANLPTCADLQYLEGAANLSVATGEGARSTMHTDSEAGGGCAAKEGDSGGNSAPCAVMLINCFAKPHLTTGDGGGVLGGGVQ
eukprot:gene14087-biopygen11704